MMEPDEFDELLRRVREGDESAATALVRLFEPEIRLEVRVRLRLGDPRLRRAFDSVDICQSVLASFFARAAVGQYQVEDPQQLRNLLLGMARNKLFEQIRYQRRQQRDVRRVEPLGDAEGAGHQLQAAETTPSQLIAGRELLQAFQGRLSEDERRLADLRAAAQSWDEIATAMGGTPEARRKQLARAVERIAQQLGLASSPGT